jgi:hypothetical protein
MKLYCSACKRKTDHLINESGPAVGWGQCCVCNFWRGPVAKRRKPDADGIEGDARGPEDTPFAIVSLGGVMLLASLAGMAIMALVIWALRWW